MNFKIRAMSYSLNLLKSVISISHNDQCEYDF